jgi:pseudouridine-5'-phosphate glycosidase
MNSKLLDLSPPVAAALNAGCPVVALESSVITHEMPYPRNVETALAVEQVIWHHGCVPATMAVLGGRLKAGLSQEELEYLGKAGLRIAKASRRDLPVLSAKGLDGSATTTTSMMIAHLAGIEVFATDGVGGVHRGAETSMDVSADLEELARTPVMVVCSGPQSILDLRLTLEYLETRGVPVLGYRTMELPAFYTRQSGFALDYRMESPAELAAAFRAQRELGLQGGTLVCNPVPEKYAMNPRLISDAVEKAVEEGRARHIRGKELTPFLLSRLKDLTGGESLECNIQILLSNARLAAQTAVELKKRSGSIKKV